jgi:hypothetical protein
MMPLRHAEVTRHAWLRFLKRWEGEPPESYRDELGRLMSIAEEVSLGYAAAVRMITNGFIPARYFVADYWRFVTDEDVTMVVTIERPYLTGKKPNNKIRDKKRYGGKP